MAPGNTKKFELKLGRAGLVLTIAGMAVLLCVFFIIGVHVGKDIETQPEKISSMPKRLLSLFWKPAGVSRIPAAEDRGATGANEALDLAQYNDAVTDGKSATPDAMPAAVKKPEEGFLPDVPEATSALPPVAAKQAVVEPQANKANLPAQKPPEQAVAKKPAKETVPKQGVSGPVFIVHVASFKDKNRAFQVHKTVAGMGYASRVIQADIRGKGTWYRIVVSGFETQAKAQVAADKISKKVNTKCIIRRVDAN
ncbi:MAG: SPOR domain-containing protein [Smithellaceae bacterium]